MWTAGARARRAGGFDPSVDLVDGEEERRKDHGDDRHELHQDVERGARGVLEGVADRVAGDGGLEDLRLLGRDLCKSGEW